MHRYLGLLLLSCLQIVINCGLISRICLFLGIYLFKTMGIQVLDGRTSWGAMERRVSSLALLPAVSSLNLL